MNAARHAPAREKFDRLMSNPRRLALALRNAKRRGGTERALAHAAGVGSSSVGPLLKRRGLTATRDGRLVPYAPPPPPRDNPAPIPAGRTWNVEAADALAWLSGLPDRSVSLVFTSPPFEGQRSYGIGFARRGQEWVNWLRPIVREAARVSRGLVIVNASSPVRDGSYSPAVEWLVSDLTRLDGLVCGPSPYAWVKAGDRDGAKGNGMPGSGGTRYQRRDWEALYTFCLPDRLPLKWTDNTAGGEPPRGVGGDLSARTTRGEKRHQRYRPPAVANPGNVIRASVGRVPSGSEAPMPLEVAARLVRWFVPPGEAVADPFAGSGTTIAAAILHGRKGLGCDVRAKQVELARRRLAPAGRDYPSYTLSTTSNHVGATI
jgi:hypothetical protein